jgi:hypothetical protein
VELVEFFEQQTGKRASIYHLLHQWFTEDLDLQSKMRYKIPFYFGKSWICYVNPIKGDGVELAFLKGRQLSEKHAVLDRRERKMVAGIYIYDIDEVPWDELEAVMEDALVLDEKAS